MLDRDRALEALASFSRSPDFARGSGAAAAGVRAEGPPPGADLPPLDQVLGGSWEVSEHGRAFVKETWFALDHRHGGVPLGASLEAAEEPLAAVLGRRGAPRPSRLGFFDTETTGLAGGTGTYVFLAGIGSFEERGFRLRQHFLHDLEGEKAMLAAVAADLERLDGLVTYNGRAFDVPLLEARQTLARLRSPLGDLPHFDLLRPVRRLYRGRLPSCRLAEAEARLVGLERSGDIAGHLIPSIYFDYVRAGRVSPLRPVLRHNALDVLSLAALLAALADLFARAEHEPEDAVALARWWELEDDPGRAEALYRSALPRLDPASPAGPWAQAAARCALLLKRRGARGDAEDLWRRLWREGDREAGLELAKHLEHHERDLEAAEEVARALLEAAPELERPELEHRLARIRRKREGRGAAGGGEPASRP